VQVGDGVTCIRTDPCSPSPCSPGVSCTADLPAGRHHCGPCPPGLWGDGLDCRTVPDPCQPNPCYPGVACRSLAAADGDNSEDENEEGGRGEYECGVCPPGMEGNGKDCKGRETLRFCLYIPRLFCEKVLIRCVAGNQEASSFWQVS
jgi:hypothetical protein